MHWLLLLFALASLTMAFVTDSVGLALLCLLLAAALSVAWVLMLLAARVEGAARDEIQILSPEELRRLGQRSSRGPASDDEPQA